MYSRDQFMNPGPAPRAAYRPPAPQPHTQNTSSSLPGNMAGLSMHSPASANASTTSLLSLASMDKPLSASQSTKSGSVKVKDDGLFKSFVWQERWLVLRGSELAFYKSANSNKMSSSIPLREVIAVERSDEAPLAFQIKRSTKELKGATAPPDDFDSKNTKTTICKVETNDDDVYDWIDIIYAKCPTMGGVSNPTNFTHQIHVGFDQKSGGFTGLPVEWGEAPDRLDSYQGRL